MTLLLGNIRFEMIKMTCLLVWNSTHTLIINNKAYINFTNLEVNTFEIR